MDPSAPRVAVLILTHNGREYVTRCVKSVLASDYPNLKVQVIDNGSTDGTIDLVQTRFPEVETVVLPENLGFAGGYNEAIHHAGEPLVVLLNQDTEVQSPHWVSEMVTLAEAHPDCAVVACKLFFRTDPDTVNSLGGMAYWFTGCVDLGFGEPEPPELDDIEPFAGSGAAMLVRRDLFQDVRGFDDAFFMYCEDFDLCWRFQLRGYRTILARKTRILHDFSPGLGRLSPRKVYLVHRNYLRAMLKNYGLGSLIRGLPQFFLFTVLKSLGLGFRLGGLEVAWAPWRAIGWNLLKLRDTWERRRSVQQTRVVADRDLFDRMGPGGFEPLRSIQRRLRLGERKREATRP